MKPSGKASRQPRQATEARLRESETGLHSTGSGALAVLSHHQQGDPGAPLKKRSTCKDMQVNIIDGYEYIYIYKLERMCNLIQIDTNDLWIGLRENVWNSTINRLKTIVFTSKYRVARRFPLIQSLTISIILFLGVHNVLVQIM